jgi:CheY-like chemotaxis protein
LAAADQQINEPECTMTEVEDKFILLIEDNPDDTALALRAFKRARIGNKIVCVDDGVEAVDFLFGQGAYAGRDIDQLPQLILLDLNMPRMNGLEVLQKIRETPHTRYLPVVVLTTSNEERDLLQSYDLGANSYVRKPVDYDQFVDAVSQLGLYWLVLNELPKSVP